MKFHIILYAMMAHDHLLKAPCQSISVFQPNDALLYRPRLDFSNFAGTLLFDISVSGFACMRTKLILLHDVHADFTAVLFWKVWRFAVPLVKFFEGKASYFCRSENLYECRYQRRNVYWATKYRPCIEVRMLIDRAASSGCSVLEGVILLLAAVQGKLVKS